MLSSILVRIPKGKKFHRIIPKYKTLSKKVFSHGMNFHGVQKFPKYLQRYIDSERAIHSAHIVRSTTTTEACYTTTTTTMSTVYQRVMSFIDLPIVAISPKYCLFPPWKWGLWVGGNFTWRPGWVCLDGRKMARCLARV